MLNFSVDSLQKKAHLEVLLKGEPEPLTIVVERYELVGGEKETAVILHEATASKEWMNAVLKEFVVGKRIAIPSKYASMARFVL